MNFLLNTQPVPEPSIEGYLMLAGMLIAGWVMTRAINNSHYQRKEEENA